MADYAGAIIPAILVATTYAFPAARFRYGGDVSSLQVLVVPPVLRGTYAAGGVAHGVPVGGAIATARLATEYTVGHDWFDRVHILPRTHISLGNIVTQIITTFELFSAHRVTITLTAFTNNIGAGVTIPDLPSLPVDMAPFTSLTDPGSVAQLYNGSGLLTGTFLPMEIVIDRDGVPTFDDSLEFFFGTGEVRRLLLSGSRISIVLPIYEKPIDETWEFPEDVIESDDESEQRISVTPNPMQSLRLDYMLDGGDRQRMHSLLHGARAQLLAMPLYHEGVRSTAAASASATSIAVEATTDLDFRVGGYALILDSAAVYDVVQLSAVATNLLTFTDTPLVNSYAVTGRMVVPVRLGVILGDISSSPLLRKLERFQFSFQVTDNDTGAPAGSTSGWSTYLSKVLLDDPNVVERGVVDGQIGQRVHVVDNQTGSISIDSDSARSHRRSQKGFSMRSRSEIARVRNLLRALRGSQVSWRLPTFQEDFTVVASLVQTAVTMDVEHVSYAKFSAVAEPRKHIRITFTDGTHLDREIVSAVEVSTAVERLTLGAAWPANRTADEVSRVEFLQLCRFATPRFTFRYERRGRATLVAPTKTLTA